VVQESSIWVTLAKAVPGIVTAVTAIIGVRIAASGLTRWRQEAIGKRRVELAEDVLADFYEARDIMEAARSPMGFDNEGITREKEDWETARDTPILNAYFRTFERLSNKAEFFARLGARQYRFVALFGREAAKPYDEIYKIHREILVAVRMLITTYQDRREGSLPQDRKTWEKVIGWRPIGEDPITTRIDLAIGAMEATSHPIIQEAGSK